MSDSTDNSTFVFIIGSPRSGTTILGEILDKHENISQWYEPYFVWDRHFRTHHHDERTAEEATPKIINQIYTEFSKYKQRTGSRIIVDKSPRNSLKLPFIMKIFPQARFIHILRDGRDATLSIHKEWLKRKDIVNNPRRAYHFNYEKAFIVVFKWMQRQSFFSDKMRALWFETHGHFFNKKKHLNRVRWNGNVGWGPRFKGWETIFCERSTLQFNAIQWLKCIECIQRSWSDIPIEQKIEIRYEDFICKGEQILTRILNFLNLDANKDFWKSIPELKANNFNKWKNEFSREQISQIHTILAPMLVELGYEENADWAQ
jgi:hypothetical protein